jgi:cytochrome P450
LDLLQGECLRAPYGCYARLRSEDPVHQTPQGRWILTRHDDVGRMLRDARFGRQGFAGVLGPPSLLFRDPPAHTRLRALVGRAFTSHVVEQVRPQIHEIVDTLIDRVRDARTADLIADFAFPLPVRVICDVLGVPAADRLPFERWAQDIARSLDATSLGRAPDLVTRGAAAHEAIEAYLSDLIAERRRRRRDDLVSALIAVDDDGDALTDDELLATCGLFFVAGHETTVNLIGNGVLCLLLHADGLAAVRNDPHLLPNAVEEVLRYESPIQRAVRLSHADVDIGDRTIAKGAIVSAILGAANRDPSRVADPDRFDVTRPEVRHVAFGAGPHFCLGAPLARAEAQIAIGTLVRRLPRLALADDGYAWRESVEVRGLERLRVRF